VGAADFDGDGKTDLVWRNRTTGGVGIWIMNGLTRVSGLDLPPMRDQAWQIAGVGDFEGTGRPVLFWRNSTTGANVLWRVARDGGISVVNLPEVAGAVWEAVGPR
ncbi:MAG TPA: VCBS repeat-containing protein, partial [Thermoanaerobaculia bacterium]